MVVARLARAEPAGGARRVVLLDDGEAAVIYTTVYLIERSLSLDNLFVFLLLFAYFGVPYELPAAAALLGHRRRRSSLRGLVIAGGIALIEQFHFVIYLLGVLLILLAVPDLARRRGERRSRPQPDGAARAADLPGHRRVPRAATGSSTRAASATRRRSSSASRRSSSPTSRSRSTRSRRPSRSRRTRC